MPTAKQFFDTMNMDNRRRFYQETYTFLLQTHMRTPEPEQVILAMAMFATGSIEEIEKIINTLQKESDENSKL